MTTYHDPTPGQPGSFLARVVGLRRSWEEKHALERLVAGHDFRSQYALLSLLHVWATEAVADIEAGYGDSLQVTLSPLPDSTDADLAFRIVVAEHSYLQFRLEHRAALDGPHWRVAASVSFRGDVGPGTGAAPDRRAGSWSRARFEELVLAAISAYERSRKPD
jgi:hypothetical protein